MATLVVLLAALAVGHGVAHPAVRGSAEEPGGAPASGAAINSDDERRHLVPTCPAASTKNGDRPTIRTVFKAAAGVARTEARIALTGATAAEPP